MADQAEQVSTSGLVDTKQPGAAKRRQYSEAMKRQMVAETLAPGASVSVVARRHDVNSNQLFRWRRQLLPKAVVESGAMVPVEIDRRRQERQQRSKPIAEALSAWAEGTGRQLSRKSELAQAFRYMRARWTALVRCFDDGRLALDNNPAERALRCVAIGRKNYLFAGSDAGGRRAAAIYALIESAKLNGLNPQHYLTDVLVRIAVSAR